MSEWIEHVGSDAPVPDGVKVQVRFASGLSSVPVLADEIYWGPTDGLGEIVAYKIVTEH